VSRARRVAPILAILLITGCAALFPAPDAGLPIANLDVEPKPGRLEPMLPDADAPIERIASGEVGGDSFTLTSFRQGADVCVYLAPLQYGGIACAPAPVGDPRAGDVIGSAAQGGLASGAHSVSGIVVADVTRVVLTTQNGGRAEAAVVPLDVDGQQLAAFFVFLPADTHETAVSAYDADGRVLDELPMVSIAPGGPGAPPPPSS